VDPCPGWLLERARCAVLGVLNQTFLSLLWSLGFLVCLACLISCGLVHCLLFPFGPFYYYKSYRRRLRGVFVIDVSLVNVDSATQLQRRGVGLGIWRRATSLLVVGFLVVSA
jgi:hypothetical protein